jgi:3-oxoacyl-[acyl-carrier protein] reductase
MEKLKGKTAIVTGGSKGIGKAISLCFADEGANVIIFARDEAAGENIIRELKNKCTDAMFIKTDITVLKEVELSVKKTLDRFGSIDILVNNAGVLKATPTEEISEEEWAEIIAVNLTGTFYCIKSVIPVMLKQKKGKIVNISSLSGKRGSPKLIHYSAAKAGVIALTQSLAREYGPRGIYTNAVASGRVITELSKQAFKVDGKRWEKESLLGRLAEAKEIAKAVLFLASEDSSYIIGETINVNGGVFLD